MYRTPRQKRRYLITTIFLAIAIPLTAIAAYYVTQYLTGASGDTQPKGVVLSNVTSNSITLSWATDIATTSSVIVKGTSGEGSPVIDVRGAAKRKTHYIEVIDLDPAATYSFTIQSGSDKYVDSGGKPYQFTTAKVSASTPIPNPIYGNIPSVNSDDVIVYAILTNQKDTFPASAVINSTGNWILDLSGLRNVDDTIPTVGQDSNITILSLGGVNLGGKISGTFVDILDEDGKVKDDSVLTVGTNSTLLASFPTNAVVSANIVGQIPKTPTTPGTGGGTQEPDEPEVDEDEDDGGLGGVIVDEDEDESEERVFKLASDVSWKIIEKTAKGTTSVDIDTGEDTVEITNLTDTSFTVIWLSDTPVEGQVNFGTSAAALSEVAIDQRDSALTKGEYTSHSVLVQRLEPETEYFFEIISGSETLKDDGEPFKVTTFKTLSSPPSFNTVSGKVSGTTDPEDVVIVLNLEDGDGSGTTGSSTKASAIPDASGNWIATVGEMRKSDGSEYFNFGDGDTLKADALVLASTTPISESTTDIENKTITVAVKGASDSDRSIIKVAALSSYNVFNSSDFPLGVGGGGDADDFDPDIDTTPDTGLFENMIITLVAGGASVLLGYSVVSKNRKGVLKKSMLDTVS